MGTVFQVNKAEPFNKFFNEKRYKITTVYHLYHNLVR